MQNLAKFEGEIQELEVHNGILRTLGSGVDSLIKSSAILSTINGSVSLGSQTIFLATQSRLHIQSVVIKVGDKVCVGKFHRALFDKNEYIICIARKIEDNLYELCSVLSPKTGLMHMQVGMGAADKPAYNSMMKGARVWYAIGFTIVLIVWIVIPNDYSMENLLLWGGTLFVFYFIFLFIVKYAFKSLRHFNEKSEQIFKMYGFKKPEEIYLLTARHQDDNAKLILESVYEYRKAIEFDPFPESYLDDK